MIYSYSLHDIETNGDATFNTRVVGLINIDNPRFSGTREYRSRADFNIPEGVWGVMAVAGLSAP